jgi:hypothetical protein
MRICLLIMSLGSLGLAALGCTKSVPPPESFVCESDADCRLSCAVRDNCCEACECINPYHRDELEAVLAANRARCDEPCHRSCPAPTEERVARCRERRCVAE